MATASQTILQSIPVPHRALGSDFAPPRALFFTYIPAGLLLTGVMAWAMGNEAGMVLASIVATIVSFYTFGDWLLRSSPTRFSTLMASGLLFGYGAGALNTWLTLPRAHLTVGQMIGLGDDVLARGLGAVLMSTALLYFLGEIFEPPVFGREFVFTIEGRGRALIYVGTLLMLVGYKTHKLIMGGAASGNGHVSAFGEFLAWMYAPLIGTAISCFLLSARGWHKLYTGLCSAILLSMFVVVGRRGMLYAALIILLTLGLAGYNMRGRIFQKVLVVAGLAGIVAVSAVVFMLLRIAGSEVRGNQQQQASIGKRFQIANKLIQRGGAFELAGRSSQQNFQKRTFVLGFFADTLDASFSMTPALGLDAWYMCETVIPRVLDPDKGIYLGEEGLVDVTFERSWGDEANSVLTAGATDFGFIGVMLYPLLLVLLVRAVFGFISMWFGTIPLLFMTLSLIALIMQTEVTLSGYFGLLRNTILFGSVIALFMAFPRIRLRA